MKLIPQGDDAEVVFIQDTLFYMSLTFPALAKVNIMERRRFQLQTELNEDAIWLTQRAGCSGLGIIWEMPEIEVLDPAAPGPMENLICKCRYVCDRNLNTTGLQPETVSKYNRRFVHQLLVQGHGEFYAVNKMMVPIDDYPGLLAYEDQFRIRLADEWYFRVPLPTLSQPGGNGTPAVLTNDTSTPAAKIIYTLDRSPAGNGTDWSGKGNASAQVYAGPIAVPAGGSLNLTWAAYLDGYLPSFVGQATVT